jgi:hypothetical protein
LNSRPTKNSGIPPAIPPIDPSLQRQKLAFLAWLRVGFGALAGLIAGIAGFVTPVSVAAGLATANQNAYYGFYVAIIVFLGTYYLAKYRILKGIAPKDKNRLITQGIGSFIIMFIFTWVLINTLHYCLLFTACHA